VSPYLNITGRPNQTLKPEAVERPVMDRQQVLAWLFVFLMLFSSIAYAIASI
jgi:hypothetical protein